MNNTHKIPLPYRKQLERHALTYILDLKHSLLKDSKDYVSNEEFMKINQIKVTYEVNLTTAGYRCYTVVIRMGYEEMAVFSIR